MSKTLREMLNQVRDAGAVDDNNGGEDWSYSDKKVDEIEQEILQWFSDEVIGGDNSYLAADGYHPDAYKIQPEIKADQRTVLRKHGWKEPK